MMMMMFRINSPKGKSLRGRFKGERDRDMGTWQETGSLPPFLCDDGVKHANISVLESQGQARSIM